MTETTHASSPEGARYLRAGGLYVASTLYVVSWGTVLTLFGRTPLHVAELTTWLCAVITLAALAGLTWLVTLATTSPAWSTPTARSHVLRYLVGVAVGTIVVTVVGHSTYDKLEWLATLVVICGAFAAALVSTGWGVAAVAAALPACLAITLAPASMWIFVTILLANLLYVRLAMWILALVRGLDHARRTIARLSIDEERLRFSRDLHDVMGRSLSSIALKCELALSVHDNDNAKDTHIAETRDIAHRALLDMRALVHGYRDIELATELDDALILLRSASVLAEADGDGGRDLPPGAAAVAAWVVRESVTNVLKHAPAATECTITLRGGVLDIVNDGVDLDTGAIARNHDVYDDDQTDGPGHGAVGDYVPGKGLTGMRERVDALGGVLSASTTGDRFHVRCELPVISAGRGRRAQRDGIGEIRAGA